MKNQPILGESRRQRREFRAMLVAFGIDNFGTGLFLPMTVIYITKVAGVELAIAGVVLAVGAAFGFAMPAIVARYVDRAATSTVVLLSQVLQASGMVAYLFADGETAVVVAAVLLASGTQIFYSCLGVLTTETTATERRDQGFAYVAMVRSAAFGAGSLVGGLLISQPDEGWLRLGVLGNTVCLLIAALIVRLFLHRRASPMKQERSVTGRRPVAAIRDTDFVFLVAVTFLTMLSIDLFLVAVPIYVEDVLGGPGWLIGINIGMLTLAIAALSAWAVRRTDHWGGMASVRISIVALLVWSLGMAAIAQAPAWLIIPGLSLLTVVHIAGNLTSGPRLLALVAQLAPDQAKGQYFAYFQYAYSGAQLVAPLLAGLIAVSPALPWLVNAGSLLCGLWLAAVLSKRLASRPSTGQSVGHAYRERDGAS